MKAGRAGKTAASGEEKNRAEPAERTGPGAHVSAGWCRFPKMSFRKLIVAHLPAPGTCESNIAGRRRLRKPARAPRRPTRGTAAGQDASRPEGHAPAFRTAAGPPRLMRLPAGGTGSDRRAYAGPPGKGPAGSRGARGKRGNHRKRPPPMPRRTQNVQQDPRAHLQGEAHPLPFRGPVRLTGRNRRDRHGKSSLPKSSGRVLRDRGSSAVPGFSSVAKRTAGPAISQSFPVLQHSGARFDARRGVKPHAGSVNARNPRQSRRQAHSSVGEEPVAGKEEIT